MKITSYNPYDAISKVADELNHVTDLDSSMGAICSLLGGQVLAGAVLSVRLSVDGNTFVNQGFIAGQAIESSEFVLPDNRTLKIELHFDRVPSKNNRTVAGNPIRDFLNVLSAVVTGCFCQDKPCKPCVSSW
jgi:hypothetical protein